MGIDSQLVVLMPIADQKAFLGLLENLDIKPDKGDDGVYTVNHDKVPARSTSASPITTPTSRCATRKSSTRTS